MNFLPKTTLASVSFPSASFGGLSELFQWLDSMESQTLVLIGTRKLRNQNQYQRYQSRIAQVKFQGVKLGFFKNI